MHSLHQKNYYLRFRRMDREYYDRAAASIKEMLDLMGVQREEVYSLKTQGMSKSSLISYDETNDDSCCRLTYTDSFGQVVDGYHRNGYEACWIQSCLRKEFRRFSKEHPEIPQKTVNGVIDLNLMYYQKSNLLEEEAAQSIIRLYWSIGMKTGESLPLPGEKRRRAFVDDIIEITVLNSETSSPTGRPYPLGDKEYTIEFTYETHDEWEVNYDEACGVELVTSLHRRVSKLFNEKKMATPCHI